MNRSTETKPHQWVLPAYKTVIGKRAEFQRQQKQRSSEAPSLAEEYPSLKSLNVLLRYLNHAGAAHHGEVKYAVNLLHAKSFFTFGCQNPECIGGHFDLSSELACAVKTHQRKAQGELSCQGWNGRKSVDITHCSRLLQFELMLEFQR